MLLNLQELGIIKNKSGMVVLKIARTCRVNCPVDTQLCVLFDTLNAIKCFVN